MKLYNLSFSTIIVIVVTVAISVPSLLDPATELLPQAAGINNTNMSPATNLTNSTLSNSSFVSQGSITKMDKANKTDSNEDEKNLSGDMEILDSKEKISNAKPEFTLEKNEEKKCIPDPDNPSSCSNKNTAARSDLGHESKTSIPEKPEKGDPPTANAGPDIGLKHGNDTKKLDGTASYDPDGRIVTYNWKLKDSEDDCPSIELNDDDKSVATIINGPDIPVKNCNYVYELKVTDDTGLEGNDSVEVNVECTPRPSLSAVPPCEDELLKTQKSKPDDAIVTDNEQVKSLTSEPEECPTNYHTGLIEQACISSKKQILIPNSIQPIKNNTLSSNIMTCDPNLSSCTQTSPEPSGIAAPPSPAYAPSLPRPCTVPTTEQPKTSAESSSLVSRPHNCPMLHVTTQVAESGELDGQSSDVAIRLLGAPELQPDPREFQGSEAGTDIIINPDLDYALSVDIPEEYSQLGYQPHSSSDCQGTMSLNQRKTCHILVSPPPTAGGGPSGGGGPSYGNWLYVVVNVQGGDKLPTDFTVHVSGNSPNPNTFTGDLATGPVGQRVALDEGTYSVGVESVSGYSIRTEGDCQGIMPISGDIKKCTITNRSLETCNPDNPCISRPESNAGLVDTFTVTNATSSLHTGAQTMKAPLSAEFITKPETCIPGTENQSIECLQGQRAIGTLNLTSNLSPNVFLTVRIFNNDNLLEEITLEGKVTKNVELIPGSYSVQVEPIGNLAIFSGDCQDNGNNEAIGTIGPSEHQNCSISLTHEVSETSELVTQQPRLTPPLSVPTAATLIVKVHVLNGQGGQCTASSCFRFAIIGLDKPAFPGSESGTTFVIPAPIPSTGYQVTDQPTPAYYRNAYVEYKSRDCSSTINAGQTKTCTIILDDREMRASLITRIHYVHDTVAHQASDVIINLKAFYLKECCPPPEQLSTGTSIGGLLPPVQTTVPLYYMGPIEFTGQEAGTELKFWSMDLAQQYGLFFEIRIRGISTAEPASYYGCGDRGSHPSKIHLNAGDIKECIVTIDDRH